MFDITYTLLLAATVFGLFGGIAITCLVIATYIPKPQSEKHDKYSAIRIYKPSRQRKESAKRAADRVNRQLLGGMSANRRRA